MYRMMTLLVATGFVIARAQTFEVASVKIPQPGRYGNIFAFKPRQNLPGRAAFAEVAIGA
jgi:hypothetical protein